MTNGQHQVTFPDHIEILGDGQLLIDGTPFPYAVTVAGYRISREDREDPTVQFDLMCNRVTVHPLTGDPGAEAASAATPADHPTDRAGDAR